MALRPHALLTASGLHPALLHYYLHCSTRHEPVPSLARASSSATFALSSNLHVAQMARPYFAYGSNLHVAQMAQRCPDSVFLGKATLPGYRWQINQRGVANVVKSPRHHVEGLVFLVNPTDESALDRSEGVSSSLYLKKRLTIDFERHASYANVRSWELAERLAQSPTLERSSTRPRSRVADNSERMEALVYVSDKFNIDGCIRAEYIQRMENAAGDAVALGVSHTFTDEVIRPHLLPVPVPAPQRTPSGPAGKPTPSQILQTHLSPSDIRALAFIYQAPNDPDFAFDLANLRQSNRRLQTYPPGLRLPARMLDAIAANVSRPASPENARMYLVRAEEQSTTTSSTGSTISSFRSHIQTSTPDLELANELATAELRSLWARRFESGASDSPLLDWRLEGEDGRLWVSTALPGGEERVTVWVEAVRIVVRLEA